MASKNTKFLKKMSKKTKNSGQNAAYKPKLEQGTKVFELRIPRGVYGFPERVRTWLHYRQLVNFSGATTGTPNVWRANSCFDPDLTGGGHQPRGFDQWKLLFNVYLVTKFRFHGVFVTQNANNATQFAITVSDQNISAEALADLVEMKWTITDILSVSGGNKSSINFDSGDFDVAKVHGEKDIEGDPNFYSAVSANPTDIAYLTVMIATLGAGSNVNAYIDMSLDMEVIFKDQVDPGAS